MKKQLDKLSQIRDAIWALDALIDERRLYRNTCQWGRNGEGYLFTTIDGDNVQIDDESWVGLDAANGRIEFIRNT